MTTLTAPALKAISPPPDDYLLLHDVSWDFYEATLRELGERNLRITYDKGSLEIMAPLYDHEWAKAGIRRLIEILSLELDIPIRSLASVTCTRKDLKKGLEPDESYYI